MAMGPAELGPLVDLCHSPASTHPHHHGGVQYLGLGLPFCPLTALLLAGEWGGPWVSGSALTDPMGKPPSPDLSSTLTILVVILSVISVCSIQGYVNLSQGISSFLCTKNSKVSSHCWRRSRSPRMSIGESRRKATSTVSYPFIADNATLLTSLSGKKILKLLLVMIQIFFF